MIVVLLIACRGEGPSSTDDGSGGDSIAHTGETGEGGIEPIHGPGLLMHGVVQCADPSLRESMGPLEEMDLGAAWVTQDFDPPSEEFPYGSGIAVADVDGDGWNDVLTSNLQVQVFMGGPGGAAWGWPEESKARFPASDSYSRHVAPVDADGDGDLDLFLASSIADQLWRNDGDGMFVDVSVASGLTEQKGTMLAAQGSTWADVDGDHDLDVWVSNRRSSKGPSAPEDAHWNQFYLNLGDGLFQEQSGPFSSNSKRGYTFVSSFHDFDGDLDPDLYIVNDFGSLVVGNIYLRNDSTLEAVSFTDTSSLVGLGLVINGMGLGVGDLNGDIYPDMVITDWGHIHLMESSEGVWFDVSDSRGMRPNLGQNRWLSWGVALADLDNDGLSDAPIGYSPTTDAEFESIFGENPLNEPDDIFLQQADGTFTTVGDAWGFNETSETRGVLAVDLDKDGWLDLFQKSFDDRAHFWKGRCGTNAWLGVQLVGLAPNTAGIGARVTVEGGGRTWQRWVEVGGTSLTATGPAVAHFGLGDLDTVDRVTVTWRDGSTSVYQVIETRQWITISHASVQ